MVVGRRIDGPTWSLVNAFTHFSCVHALMERLRSRRARCAAAIVLAIAPLWPELLHAQPRATTAQIGAIVRNMRSVGLDSRALLVLTQAQGPQDGTVMEALGDSIAAIAILHPGRTTKAAFVRSQALSALHLSATGETRLPSGSSAVPFAGAAERLRRVSEHSHDPGIRATALMLLGEVDQSVGFLQYLRQVATSEDDRAVELLVDNRGSQGRAIARDLYRTRMVRDRVALHVLEGKASALGW